MSLLHIVLLSFSPELDHGEVADMQAQVRSWRDEIGGFEELALGAPLFTERAQGYQWMLYIVVADADALTRYQVHPVHQRFGAWTRDHGATVLAFDYVLDGGTAVVGRDRPTPGP